MCSHNEYRSLESAGKLNSTIPNADLLNFQEPLNGKVELKKIRMAEKIP